MEDICKAFVIAAFILYFSVAAYPEFKAGLILLLGGS